jgi:hypothetical protein
VVVALGHFTTTAVVLVEETDAATVVAAALLEVVFMAFLVTGARAASVSAAVKVASFVV